MSARRELLEQTAEVDPETAELVLAAGTSPVAPLLLLWEQVEPVRVVEMAAGAAEPLLLEVLQVLAAVLAAVLAG